MTPSTLTTVIITVGYLVLGLWMLHYHEGGVSFSNLIHAGAFFLPVLILWVWWFYKKRRR